MQSSIWRWFLALSIRWKLQLAFFFVTAVTTVLNRWIAVVEMRSLIALAKDNGASAQTLATLQAKLQSFILDSVWQSVLELAVVFVVIGVLANLLVAPIRALCAALKGIEQGDLTLKVKQQSLDEIGILEHSFNEMLESLITIMRSTDDSVCQMGQSSYQIAVISKEISEISKNEQSRSAEVSSATEQLHEVSYSVRSMAEEAKTRANQTEGKARSGIIAVQANISEMEGTAREVNQASREVAELNTAADKIRAIIATIRSIADQTNLLSLNAAIEAARAGEQGRGFAVVADEVRKLALRTANATGEITNIIGALGGQVQQVTTTMNTVVERVRSGQANARETASVINSMVTEVTQTAEANQKISEATQTQLDQFILLQCRLDTLFATLRNSSSKTETTARIGEDLHKVTEKLKTLMGRFKFDRYSAPEVAQNDKRKAPRAHRSLLVKAQTEQGLAEGTCLDFSMTGMKLRIFSSLESLEPQTFLIYHPYDDFERYQNQEPIKVIGRIAWCQQNPNACFYGIEFNELNLQQRKQLESCFDYFGITTTPKTNAA